MTEKKLIKKPPVVVVLGHIDHGKSSILEAIREDFNITSKEAGGITQHIGAYELEYKNEKITFIDTPGHEAFSAMRSRGAKVADIAILVIDSAEGVKSQTKEAINYIKKANIPFIVALNKIDKPQAQPEMVKQQLSEIGVLVEGYGGEVPCCNVSAKTKEGINDLLDLILLLAEMEDLKADISLAPEGTIIESSLDSKVGPLATLILEKGILKKGDILATSSTFGRIKNLKNFEGKVLKEAFPGEPVSILGFVKPPFVGEKAKFFESLEKAKEFVKEGKKKFSFPQQVVLEPEKKVLNVILKTDVLGTGEAIVEGLKNIPQDKVYLRVLKVDCGEISVEDIKLAEAGKAQIFGFRVTISKQANFLADQKKIKWRIFEVIYELFQAIREEMARQLEPEIKRIDLGKVKVLVLFGKKKGGRIIGGKIIEGEIEKGALLEIEREGEIIGKGRVENLQKERKDYQKLKKGEECGILFKGEIFPKEGDILIVYKEEKVYPKL